MADPENTQPPNARELAALHLTVRHLGRALQSFGRAPIPAAPRFGEAPDWWLAWTEAEDALQMASNRLIDALEAMPPERTDG